MFDWIVISMAFYMVAIVLRMVNLVFRILYRRSPKLWGGGGRVCVVLVVGAVVEKIIFY